MTDATPTRTTRRREERTLGTWDKSTFGNDTAADWAAAFEEAERTEGLELIEDALRGVLDEEGYLDSDFAVEALAACEVIARLGPAGGERSAYSEAIDAWVGRNPGRVAPALVDLAVQAIERILGEESELPELWERDAEWLEAVADLKRRVIAAR